MIENLDYIGPYRMMKVDVIDGPFQNRCSYEIYPCHIENNQWVATRSEDYQHAELRALIDEAHQSVWTGEVVAAYKKSREAEIVAEYNERTISDEQFAEIVGLIPTLKPFGHIFNPNQTFVDKMIERYEGKRVVECGAGDGYTGAVLAAAGFEVTCIDTRTYEGQVFSVLNQDALTFDFDNTMVCLICRPDSDEVLQAIIDRAQSQGCPVVYVRRAGVSAPNTRLLAENVGADGESMFQVLS